ncbi:hypothetical protein [Dactylosporangium sp. NPDC051484]|uniref:hypothetical protein n=1 Tax=Dactylosporangium sp. NPDC051484 TaxID=3154942 RepID=UPI00344EBC85
MTRTRSRALLAGLTAVVVAATGYAVHDRIQESGLHFADLAGQAHVRLTADFSSADVTTLADLPDTDRAECNETVYEVDVAGPKGTYPRATAVTATEDERLRAFQLRTGRMPAGDAEVLLDEGTVSSQGLQLGDRLTLSHGRRKLTATLVGSASRPDTRAVGPNETVVMLPTAAMAKVTGGDPGGCAQMLVRLRDPGHALAYRDAVLKALGFNPGLTFDEDLRKHI